MASTTRRTARGGSQRLDAIALLKADHRVVEALFEKYQNARGISQKESIAKQICMELAIHTAIEEELFYPACRGHIDDEIVDEAYVEHDGAKMLVAELMDSTPDEEFFDAKVTVLSEMIKHHVKEEEQRDGMFEQARAAGLDLEQLGTELASRKEELKEEYEEDGIPTLMTRALKGVPMEHGHPVGE